MNIKILRDVAIDGKKVLAGSVVDAGLVKDGLKYLLGSKIAEETAAKVCEVKATKASTKKTTAKSTAKATAKSVKVVEETAEATAEEAEEQES